MDENIISFTHSETIAGFHLPTVEKQTFPYEFLMLVDCFLLFILSGLCPKSYWQLLKLFLIIVSNYRHVGTQKAFH